MATNQAQIEYVSNKSSSSKPSGQPMEFHKLMQRYIPIVAVNLIFILVSGYFISPLSKVETVSVEGNQVVYDQTILEDSGIRSGDSVIETMQNKEEFAQQVFDQSPQISESTVVLEGFNEIIIRVKEYDTVAYIANESSYLRVLENGAVLDDVFSVSIGNQPVLSKFEEGDTLNKMIEELSKVDRPILNLISEIELVQTRSNPLFIRVYMNNGNRVLSSIPTFADKIPYYPQMVQAVNGRKGIFDMEVGVYFTPFVDGESEDSGLDEEEREALEEFNG